MPDAIKSITLKQTINPLDESCPNLRDTCAAPTLRKQSDFAFLDVPNPSEIAIFHEISPSDVSRVHPCKTLSQLKLFPYPMNRAEDLHAQIYDLSGRRKNTPVENDQVNS